MAKITTYKELEQYIDQNFDRLTEFGYSELLRTTLDVYAVKPNDKATALNQLQTFYEKFGATIGTDIETPLFLEQ
jgi:hypothetical protein